MINELLAKIQELQQSNVLWEKKWVACGDSFTEGDFTGAIDKETKFSEGLYSGKNKVYPYFIGRRNHMDVINEAVCGSTMTNMASDFRPNLRHFSIERYKKIPTDTDYITLCFGINDDDKHNKAEIGDINDTVNTTFYGAWNTVLEHLITQYPYTKIGIIIPNGCTHSYTDAIRKVARKWAIPYLDIPQDYNVPLLNRVHEKDEACETVLKVRNAKFAVNEKNTHPNAKAHEYESTFIENWLRSL